MFWLQNGLVDPTEVPSQLASPGWRKLKLTQKIKSRIFGRQYFKRSFCCSLICSEFIKVGIICKNWSKDKLVYYPSLKRSLFLSNTKQAYTLSLKLKCFKCQKNCYNLFILNFRSTPNKTEFLATQSITNYFVFNFLINIYFSNCYFFLFL